MIFRVTEIDKMLILSIDMAQALWVMKLSLIVSTIYQTNLAVSDLILKCHCVFIDYNHSIICRVSYKNQVSIQTELFLNTDDFTRVSEMLTTCNFFLIGLADSLVFALGFYLTSFLLFGLPANSTGVIESFVVKIVSN